MGYCSEVVVMIPNNKVEEAKDILDVWDEEYSDKESTYLVSKYVKWYDSYKEISDFSDFICKIHEKYEETGKNPACLIAVGEDGACHTELGDPWDHDMYTCTYIECPAILNLQNKIKESNETNK